MRTRLNVYFPPALAKQVDELAIRRRISRSAIVEAAVASYLSPDGADRMEGRGGNDLYYVNDIRDVVVELAGGGTRWIEQTVAPDTRDVYTLSFVMGSTGWPEGLTPELVVVAEVIYDDGTTETIEQKVS